MKQDPSLNDEQLENEIKLVGDLVLAASQAEGPLSEDQIDELLGVAPEDSEGAEGSEGTDGAEGSEGAEGSDGAASA